MVEFPIDAGARRRPLSDCYRISCIHKTVLHTYQLVALSNNLPRVTCCCIYFNRGKVHSITMTEIGKEKRCINNRIFLCWVEQLIGKPISVGDVLDGQPGIDSLYRRGESHEWVKRCTPLDYHLNGGPRPNAHQQKVTPLQLCYFL